LIQRSKPLETADILAFARTVEARSLSRAARELGIPRATLSRRLSRIEERLGVRLIHRTTRKLTLTDAGETLHRHAQIVLAAVREAEASVHRMDDVPRGDLRVSAPGIGTHSFHAMLTAFARRYSEVRMDVHFTTQHVDLGSGGYDVVIRAGVNIDPGLVGRTLSRVQVVAAASPEYLRKRGTPKRAADLVKHDCIMGYSRGEVRESYWPLRRGGRIHVEGSFFSNEPRLLLEAARAGLGIALVPSSFAGTALERGELVPVLPDILGAESLLMVLHLARELVPPAVKAFVEAVVEWAKDEPYVKESAACERAIAKQLARQRRARVRAK
jgi:DNA-binding transcriptional LysR family regulator